MPEFKKKIKSDGTYKAPAELYPYTDEQLTEWAEDALCKDREFCARQLASRKKLEAERAKRAEKARIVEEVRLSDKRLQLVSDPFDPRIEISADAKHVAGRIVTALWLIFVLIPIVLGVLYEVLKAIS